MIIKSNTYPNDDLLKSSRFGTRVGSDHPAGVDEHPGAGRHAVDQELSQPWPRVDSVGHQKAVGVAVDVGAAAHGDGRAVRRGEVGNRGRQRRRGGGSRRPHQGDGQLHGGGQVGVAHGCLVVALKVTASHARCQFHQCFTIFRHQGHQPLSRPSLLSTISQQQLYARNTRH